MEYLKSYDQQVEKAINQGYYFDFGKYLKEGWSLLNKSIHIYIGLTILFIAILFIVGMGLGIFSFTGGFNFDLFLNEDYKVLSIIISLGLHLIFAPLGVGAYLIVHEAKINKYSSFSTLFKAYEDFVQIALASIAMLIPSTLLSLSSQYLGVPNFIVQILELILTMLFIFVNLLISIKKYHFLTAIKASILLTKNKLPHIFLLFILLGFANLMGLLILFVGLLASIPFIFTTIYAYFYEVCMSEENEIEIEDQLQLEEI
jgi:hypothetical protein